jgi:hypothetical protein
MDDSMDKFVESCLSAIKLISPRLDLIGFKSSSSAVLSAANVDGYMA